MFFAKECFLDVPYARQTPQEPRVYKSTSFHLNYTLCFVHNVDKPFTPCIFFKKKIISNWADQINTADTISQIAKQKTNNNNNNNNKNICGIAYPAKGGFSYHLRVNVSESESGYFTT